MPNKFTHRSTLKEMLDEATIPSGILKKNLKELDILNRIAGGHSISLKGIKQLITNHSRIYHLVDLGCGSGDALKYIADWARKNNYKVQLTGIDVNEDAIAYLKIHCADYPEITGIAADYLDYLQKNQAIDIVHCSLFCHHLSDDELIDLFAYFKQKLICGFVINDLQRYWLAYYMAWLFPRLLNGTQLAKNDGPISVLRGFKKQEMLQLLTRVAINNYSMQKAWAFRFLLVGKT
jgi:SAM-dependent methyltransferase